jgi:arylsulfatase A-like enzyme
VRPLRWESQTVLLALLGLVACGGGSSEGVAGRATRPNVVLIVADDLGYADVGVHGSPDALTPAIDSIAADGVRFTDGYVSGPYCSPTRAGLVTGRYQERFGHEFNPGAEDEGLPTTEITLADRMRDAGYATGLVGKWHLGQTRALDPLERGFEEFFGVTGGGSTYYDAPVRRGEGNVTEAAYLTEAFGREAADFIDRHAEEPFFLALTFNAVHTPLQAPPAVYLDRFPGVGDPTRKTYLAMVAAMDDAIGRVLAKLHERDLDEDTLVFFLSDNGGPITADTSVNGSTNTPLRGGKKSLWEGGIRVPFLIRWNGRVPAGVVSAEPVLQLDVFTTAIAAAGGTVPADRVIDGVDLLPYLTGAAADPPHEKLFWRFGDPGPAAIRRGTWKLKTGPGEPTQLYDLSADVGETTNLAASHPEVVSELQADLDEWRSELVPPLWERRF